MQKVENLYSLYVLGYFVGQLRYAIEHLTFGDIAWEFGFGRATLARMIDGDPFGFEQTKKSMEALRDAVDNVRAQCDADPSTLSTPLKGTPEAAAMANAIVGLEVTLNHELNGLPIWLVTARRAYSIDTLINNAESILDPDSINLLSNHSIEDIRQAGKAIAFDLPTAAGFHSLRAVERIARSYHKVIVGKRPAANDDFGTVIGGLDKKKKSLKLGMDDLLPLAIETLFRVKHIRNGLAHPDKFLELSSAMNVFDSAKCAIDLMLEDAQQKDPDIPKGFF